MSIVIIVFFYIYVVAWVHQSYGVSKWSPCVCSDQYIKCYSFVVAYFQQFSGDFEPIFSLLDDLGVAISHALKTTHSKLQSKVEQRNAYLWDVVVM